MPCRALVAYQILFVFTVPSKMEWRIFKGEDSLSLSVANNAETNTLVSTTA